MTPPQKFFPNKNANETSFNLAFVNLLSNYGGGVAYTQFQTVPALIHNNSYPF